MALAEFVDHHRHPQGPARQALLDEEAALQELEILAIAHAVVRELPPVDEAPMLLVGDRLDPAVHPAVDRHDGVPRGLRQRDGARLVRVDRAFGRHFVAEPDPAEDRLGGSALLDGLTGRREGCQGLRLARSAADDQGQADQDGPEEICRELGRLVRPASRKPIKTNVPHAPHQPVNLLLTKADRRGGTAQAQSKG
jgi:hypothetical protein